MNISPKILIVVFCAALLSSAGFLILRNNISDGTGRQVIKITKIKSEYGTNENIIITGQAIKNSKINLFWNNEVGGLTANDSGEWVANLGKMPEGKYALELAPQDASKNSGEATGQVSVVNYQNREMASLIDSVAGSLAADIFWNNEKAPEKLIMVSTSVPLALRGEWNLVK